MPQLDFSWWLFHLIINWSLLATMFFILTNWNNTQTLNEPENN
uniref:ATP synthase F0 subunit 8 n=1 Tax=Amphiura digitula TaxID=2588555 RepID=A0A4Y5T0Z7_9ECHI|nr:ATP synthase F0 subunit 8 [Amphiura digitula]QDA81579.1 ATP synthase F0 subunit 8 [Amphiura digitula]QHT54237.1 ATP synthase F0 subunit 8 [Amphiura digitula]